jgi:HEAT repeat protein
VTTLERLRASQLDERLAAVAELAARADVEREELEELCECLGAEPKVLQRRAAEALTALHQRGLAVTPLLLAALQAGSRQQRWGAVYALSRMGAAPAPALPVLLECLGVDDGDVRWAAADILVHMEQVPDRFDALRNLLATGNPAQRKMAAYCLRDLEARSEAIEPALFAALHDAEPSVRMAAMSSLARLYPERPTLAHHVVLLLADPDAGVRRAAAVVLGTLRAPSAPVLAALREAAASADPSLQRAALRSLRQLHA